jgi:uncharacterized membrane protein YeaQ/YmgE (transglycosylase-associated protein family)
MAAFLQARPYAPYDATSTLWGWPGQNPEVGGDSAVVPRPTPPSERARGCRSQANMAVIAACEGRLEREAGAHFASERRVRLRAAAEGEERGTAMFWFDSVLGWMAIGAAASLGGMIWPFRRGVGGVLANLFVGIGGAVAFGLLSIPVYPPDRPHAMMARLGIAAVGSLLSLWIVHVIWMHEKQGAH